MQQPSPELPAVIQALAPVVAQYGYWGVMGAIMLEDFGLPAPGETVLIAAAAFAGLGRLNIWLVVVAGFVGAVIGDNIGFAIGDFGGRPLLERYGKWVFLPPERLAKAEAFFNRHGGKVVVAARFIEGLRQLNGIIAGASEMRWSKFLAFNALGAALWVGTWSIVGYVGGSHITTFLHYQAELTVMAGVVLVTAGAYWVWRKRLRTR